MVARLHRENVNLHGFILTVKGREKAKAYCPPFREGEPHRLYSVSKTMVALALSLLLEDGLLRLDDHIVEFFPDLLPEKPHPWLSALTLRDMLRMATCYSRTAYREYVDEDWTVPFFTSVPDHAPGTVFAYDTGCSQVLASLVKRLSGLEVIDFLDRRLFVPLGCRDRRFWLRDPAGQCTGGTGLCMSLRDLNRVALCLSRGGDGLLPAWFVADMQRKQIDTSLQANQEERWGYGWQCWRTRAGWALYGMGGQLAVICPEKDAVFCTVGDVRLDPCGVQRIYNAFFEELYPYLSTEDTPPLSLSLEPPSLPHRADFAFPSAGAYVFGENPLGLKDMRLEPGRLVYRNRRGECVLPFSPGQTVCADFPGWPGEPATVSAGCPAPGVLLLSCHAVGDFPCGFLMTLALRPGALVVQCRRSADPRTDGYEGVASGAPERTCAP